MYYRDKRESLMNIMRVLNLSGWKIYGFKEDRSDLQVDYFDPASWDGIAVKNGFILVVDGYATGKIGGDFIKTSYDAKIQKRISKLIALRDNHAASKGERDNAIEILENLCQKVEIKELIQTDLEPISYQPNPKNAKWHIEKDGVIIAKGTGVFLFSNSSLLSDYSDNSKYLYTDKEELNYKAGYMHPTHFVEYGNCSVNWNTTDYKFEDFKEDTLKKRADRTKLLNKLFNLVEKWNKLTVIKLGDGETETLTRIIVKKKVLSYYEAKEVTHKTGYITCSNKYSYVGNIRRKDVYKLEKDSEGNFLSKKLTRKYIDGQNESKIIKTEPRKNTKGNYYGNYFEDKIINVELVPVYEVIEVEKWVKVNEKKTNKKPTTHAKKAQKTKTPTTQTTKETQTELLNIIFSSTPGTWTNKKGEEFNTLILTQRVKKENWKAFTALLKDEGIGYYNFKAKAIICDKVTPKPTQKEETTTIKEVELPKLFKEQNLFEGEDPKKTIVDPTTNFKKDFNATLKEVKENKEDFEWYPTPREVIAMVHANCYDYHSFMDVGAGNGSFFEIFNSINEKNQIVNKYAIEKSQTLINAMPHDVMTIGTDFNNQTFIDKKVDSIYCNPPYSQFKQWSTKLIREANAKSLFLLIPERAEDNKAIKEALEFRNADIRQIYTYDFKNSEFRKARAKVRLYKITFKTDKFREENDPFTQWFNEEFDLNAKKQAFSYDERNEKEESIKNELVKGGDMVERLVNMYNAEMSELMKTMHEVMSLSTNALNAMGEMMQESTHITGISKKKFIKAFELRIDGLKKLYWNEIFNNLDKIKEKLTSKSRQSMLDTLTKNTNIDFTASNIYAVLIWVIKNANKYFDSQLIEVYKEMTDQENIKNYKSNKRMITDRWRFNDEIKAGTFKYILDYRTVHAGCGIQHDRWGQYENSNISNKGGVLLEDLAVISNNLGFKIDANIIKSNYWLRGDKNNISFKDGSVFVETKAYENGNMHLKFNQKFMKALNIEAGRLNGWLKSPKEAAQETGATEAEANKFFNSSLQLTADPSQLLLA